jgi:hypothetical protein
MIKTKVIEIKITWSHIYEQRVERYFLTSQYDNTIICLDHILSYEDFIKKLRETLVKYNDEKDINQKILEDCKSVKVVYINKVYKRFY